MSQGSIRGRVLTPEGAPLNGVAQLTLQSMNGGQVVVFTDYQGQFNFPGLDPGAYTLEAEGDRQVFAPVSRSVEVYPGVPSVITVGLKYKEGARRPAGAAEPVVSAAELDKSIPEKARKEFKRGTEAAAAGRATDAVAHFRKALDLHPDFMMARNDLGVQLMALGRLEEATEQLRAAVRLDPKAFNPLLNLGIVLVRQQQFAEAADALAKAVSANPRSPAARLYAGESYAGIGDPARAEKEFKTAFELGGADYALALFHLGHLYLARGERERALATFEAYLRAAPGAANAAEVRRLVGMLR
jgi:tetratricopeptide (TPR) repeat protein